MELGWVIRALEVAGLSGVRPSWVLVATAAAGAMGVVTFPEGLGWLASWPGAGALLVFAIIEHFAERDTDMLQIFGAVQLGLSATTAILATGALARAQTHLSLGVPVWAVQVAAVVIALATIGLRRQLKLKLMQLSANATTPTKWVARIEEGGLVAGGAMVVLSPLILAGVLVMLAMGGVALLVAWKALDRRGRRPCHACSTLVRREAQRCPKCRVALEPETALALPEKLADRVTGWRTPRSATRRRRERSRRRRHATRRDRCLDHRTPQRLVFTVPLVTFGAIQSIFDWATARVAGAQWHYGNVFVPRRPGVPLHWW